MLRDRTATFDKGNATAASIILESPVLYPEGSGLERWARAWQAGHPARERRWQQKAVVASVGIVVQRDGEQLEMFTSEENAAWEIQLGRRDRQGPP